MTENKTYYNNLLFDQDSENEFKRNITFYTNIEGNILYRCSFNKNYEKEIDGIFTNNNEINLSIK